MGGQKTIGVIHSEAFNFLKKNYKQMWVISLILYGVEMALGIVISIFIAPMQIFAGFIPSLFVSNSEIHSIVDMVSVLGPLFAVIGVASLAFTIVVSAVEILQYASYIGGYDATIQLLDGSRPAFETVAGNFKRNWKRFVGVVAWAMLWEFLWSLLFIIPGIVKSYSYKLAPFLVLQYPDMTIRQALTKSMEITNGYKGRLFGLDVLLFLYQLASVLGVCLIVVGAIAIELLWLMPMMLLLYTIAWRDIRQAAIEKGLLPNR